MKDLFNKTKTLEESYYILEGEKLREKYKGETKLKSIGNMEKMDMTI